jgi:hypothetical protein
MSKIIKQPTSEEPAKKPEPYALWRILPAESFDVVRRLEVMCHVGLFTTNIKERKEAVAGDAASAVRIALQMKIPEEINYSVDARMTLLAHAALNGSAGATLVLSHMLRQMPLEPKLKNRLATSWLVRNLRLVGLEGPPPSRDHLFVRRSIASQLLGKPLRKS